MDQKVMRSAGGPAGEVNCTDCGGWDNLAQLLKAGIAGAEAGNPAGHKLLVMMHYDQGGNQALSSAFYSQLTAHGVPFDIFQDPAGVCERHAPDSSPWVVG
jgi:arabinogalactan endo-1,4-beta-galactosidase